MGLAVEVGVLADLIKEDPEAAAEVGLEFDAINAALASKGHEQVL